MSIDIIDRALFAATHGHKGVTRWDKKTPYIEHPKAVAEIAVSLMHVFPVSLDEVLVRVIALGHDLVEDVDAYLDQEEKYACEVLLGRTFYSDYQTMYDQIVTSLRALNKHRHKDYLAFTLAAKADPYARVVKIADLSHNLSDLTKGSMREKYLLARYILES